MLFLRALLVGGLCVVAAGCDPGFEEETEVIDLRPIGVTVTPPEQVLDLDLTAQPNPQEILAQLVPVDICGLSGDPIDRAVQWSFTVCVEGDDVRCDPDRPQIALASGVAPDPETARPRPQMCARLMPDLALLAVLQSAIDADPLSGFSGIDLLIQWRLRAEGNAEVVAGKRVRFSARVPETRTANTNPFLTGFTAVIVRDAGEELEVPLPLGRCVDQVAPLTLVPGEELRITPVEPDGLRETYVVPTFDGMIRQFTENIEYQWLTSSGSFSSNTSGGKRDPFGNLPELDSSYRTRGPQDLTGPVDAALWIVQRDERLGEAWFESCVRVVP